MKYISRLGKKFIEIRKSITDQKPMRITLKRTEYSDKQTLGELTIGDKVFKTLELEEDKNAVRDDCIPKGVYKVVKRYSNKYGNHFHVLNVPNRSMILIHHGNYHTDILGCILVGKTHTDINKDGLKDVTHSKATMAQLNELLPDEFELEIL